MSSFRVLVVGASIAGPTTAYWLARAGAQVTVVERFPTLRTGGQNVDIRTTGVAVMRKMEGMEEAVRSRLHQVESLSFVYGDGTPIASMGATGDADSQFLLSEYEIFRGDLSHVLYDLTKDDRRIRYVFGEQVRSMMHQGEDGPVTVEFMNGKKTADFDLVVACDGATSRTRALGFGNGVFDNVDKLNAWAAWFTIKDKMYTKSNAGQAFSAPGGRFVAVGPDEVKNHTGSKVTMMSVGSGTISEGTSGFREASAQGEDALKSFVSDKFRSAGWLTDDFLDGMANSKDFYGSEMVQVKLPRLYKNRFVVVGDAGYAPGPTGMGTSLAMTGAYILAGEIATHRGKLSAGLAAYETRMRPIITDMQKIPPGVFLMMAPQTERGIQVRNLAFRFICWMMQFRGLFSWMSGYIATAFSKDKFPLPDYKFDT